MTAGRNHPESVARTLYACVHWSRSNVYAGRLAELYIILLDGGKKNVKKKNEKTKYINKPEATGHCDNNRIIATIMLQTINYRRHRMRRSGAGAINPHSGETVRFELRTSTARWCKQKQTNKKIKHQRLGKHKKPIEMRNFVYKILNKIKKKPPAVSYLCVYNKHLMKYGDFLFEFVAGYSGRRVLIPSGSDGPGGGERSYRETINRDSIVVMPTRISQIPRQNSKSRIRVRFPHEIGPGWEFEKSRTDMCAKPVIRFEILLLILFFFCFPFVIQSNIFTDDEWIGPDLSLKCQIRCGEPKKPRG